MADGGWAAVGAAVLVASSAWLVTPTHRRVRMSGLGGGREVPTTPREQARLLMRAAADRMRVGPLARRRAAAQRIRVIQALGALASELEAGQVPVTALHRCAGEPPVWPCALGAVALDGDVAAGLVADGRAHPVLLQLAACWRVAAESGSGLAESITRLAASARMAEEVRVELEAQLAGPRATARTLSVLPAVGIGFGIMLGADPLAWLVGSTPGRGCLAAGLALTGIGMWWTGRIAHAVERQL